MNHTPSPLPPAAGNAASDENFFVLRDLRDRFLLRLEEIASLAGFSRETVAAFTRAAGEAYDALAEGRIQHGFGETAGLTASRISLVGPDDLELEIRIGEILHRLKDDDRIDHWRVQLRLATLLRRPGLSADDNPVGLSVLEPALWALCDASDGDLERKLALLERTAVECALRLPELYAELNTFLEQRHVDPTQPQRIVRQPIPRPGPEGIASTAPSASAAGNPFAALQQTLLQHNGGAFSAPPQNAFAPPFGAPSFGAPSFGAPPPGAFPSLQPEAAESQQAALASILQRLQHLEQRERPAGPLRSHELEQPLTGPAAATLDTLALIFDAIFAAPELPDPVKAAIGRLQIPLLRIALTDPNVFTDTNHPARELINRMARAAFGLPRDSGRDHPLCTALAQCAERVREDFDRDDTVSDLTPHLATLDAVIDERDLAIERAARPYRELVEAREDSDAADLAAAAWVRQALQDRLPDALGRFLAEQWRRVLTAAGQADAGQGEHWQAAVDTAADLIWSVQPKANAEERQKLAALIPSLLRRLNAGLDSAGIAAAERTPFLDAFFDLQTAALRGRSAPEGVVFAALPERTSDALQILQRQGILVQYCAGQTPPSDVNLAVGDWIEFTLPEAGERLSGRYCGNTSRRTRALIYNVDWGYAVALPAADLDRQLRDSRARRLNGISLFDRAAAAALERISRR